MLLRPITACFLFGTILAGPALQAQTSGGTTAAAAAPDISPALFSDPLTRNQSPSNEALSVAFMRAVASQKSGNLESAAREYQRILEKHSDMPEVHNNLGIIFQALGDMQSARKEFEESLHLASEYAACLNNLASLFYQTGEYTRSRDLCLKAIAKNPLDSEYRFNLALICLKTKEPEKSIAAIIKALALNPKYASAYEVLGETLLGQGDYQGALRAYLSYLDCKPDPADTVSAYVQHQVVELQDYLGMVHDQAPGVVIKNVHGGSNPQE
jgi:tetratricopeptide (TPR) repeat protein